MVKMNTEYTAELVYIRRAVFLCIIRRAVKQENLVELALVRLLRHYLVSPSTGLQMAGSQVRRRRLGHKVGGILDLELMPQRPSRTIRRVASGALRCEFDAGNLPKVPGSET
ncbi:MAG TPA: hypothetical protein DDW52_00360 [Planctomycetaceae bacterium]|nr:hypothetical protein [Planctomycetaceae bacterium]